MSKILFFLVLFGISATSFADRGGLGKKKKETFSLNADLRGGLGKNLGFNLSNGLRYKGSLLNVNTTAAANHSNLFVSGNNAAITFQKGNNIYIMPFKQKRIVPESKPGYSGLKVVLKVP